MVIRLHNDLQEELISLWQEAFGDEREFITSLFDHFQLEHIGWGYMQQGKLTAMAFTLPLQRGLQTGYYLYACATLNEYRGLGMQSALIHAILQHTLLHEGAFVITLPAEESLFEYYSRFEFRRITLHSGEPLKGLNSTKESSTLEEYTLALSRFLPNSPTLDTPSHSQWAIHTLVNDGYSPYLITQNHHTYHSLYTIEGQTKGTFSIPQAADYNLPLKDFMVAERTSREWHNHIFLFPQE